MYSKPFIAFGVFAVFLNAAAQPAPPSNTAVKSDWVRAMVVTDGGSVYSEPDFDAKVAEYLSFKAPIWASRKAVPGRGGLGLFHHVHYQNKNGYMADTDIRILDKVAVEPAAGAGDKKSKKIHSKAFEDEESGRKSEPLYFTPYVGGALGYVNFSEKFESQTLHSNMLMYGLRMSGPGTLFAGMPLDFNLLFSLQKPGYYSGFAQNVSGFLVFGDVALMLPFAERTDWLWTYSLGLMYTFTNYKVQIAGVTFDSREFRIGLDAGLGGAYRFGPAKHKIYAIRADAKYYFEKTRYFGFLTSFQTEY